MAVQAAQRVDGFGSAVPIHPLLFAAYPVIRLYEENMVEVEFAEVFLPMLVVVGVAALGLAALTLLFRDPRRGAIVTSAIVLPAMLFGLLRELGEPYFGEDTLPLLLIGIGIVVFAVVVALRAGPRLGTITLGLNVIALVLVLVAAIPAARGVAAALGPGEGEPAPAQLVDLDSDVPTRDIYHLVLDRYGSEQALETGFGIANDEFIAWLREQGFQVVDGARANYAKTTMSLGATLGMSLLDEIAQDQGPESENLAPVVKRIKSSAAGTFLQDLGYEYVHIGSWYNQTRDSRIADRTINPEEEVSLATTLYDLSVLPLLDEEPSPAEAFRRKHAESAIYQFATLKELIEEPGRKYVLAHVLVPHPPYVFLEDGSYDSEHATFETQLADTNRRLREIIEPLLARPEEERPIIILQADEGPFPERLAADEEGFDWAEATDAELITKFGILDAMYLPGPEGTAPLPDDMTAVNTYPELFRRYFAADIADQPDRVYASSKVTPYDLLDITARLDNARLDAARG